jgi:hypothetical protein
MKNILIINIFLVHPQIKTSSQIVKLYIHRKKSIRFLHIPKTIMKIKLFLMRILKNLHTQIAFIKKVSFQALEFNVIFNR